MPALEDTSVLLTPAVLRRRARQCRRASWIILLVGLVAAGAVYGLQSPPVDYRDDPALGALSRAEDRQMGMLYGKQGQLMEDLNHSLQQPRTQAMLILFTTAVGAGAALYLARRMDHRLAEMSGDASNLQPVPGQGKFSRSRDA